MTPSLLACWEMSTVFAGNNIDPRERLEGHEYEYDLFRGIPVIKTTEGCMGLCQQRPDCTAWSHNPGSRLCFLKNSDKGRRQQCGFTSGQKHSRNCSTGMMMMMSGCGGGGD